MKRLKINLAVIALLIGTAAAFATKSNTSFSTVRWFKTGSGWQTEASIKAANPGMIPVCNSGSSNECSALFNDTDNPNNPGVTPVSSYNLGVYQLEVE